ncbi:hypothetical protein BDV25DRAFT_137785 [Aspergillus avenaceus]|uniref:Uncharacterized protein n=1 Tax=Aspergillus avenaceus TaxID=36643 RepID=A0A5N6U2X2_ASPAV|nr:hypothetical protein BDV25DRAFT_137785 [Aspergillus avenaceus]
MSCVPQPDQIKLSPKHSPSLKGLYDLGKDGVVRSYSSSGEVGLSETDSRGDYKGDR